MRLLSIFFIILAVASSAYAQGPGFQLKDPVQVPTPEGRFTMPSFAPGSGAIAFSAQGYGSLYVADWKGNVSKIADAPMVGWRYAWGPDGQSVAYRMRYGDTAALAGMVASKDGSVQTQVTDWQNDLYPPKWDKNGITYKTGDDILTVDDQGKVKSVKTLSDGRGIVSRAAGLSAALWANGTAGATIASFAALIPAAHGKGNPNDVITNADNELYVVDENGELKKLDAKDESGFFSPQTDPTGGKVAAPGLSGNLYIAGMNGGDTVNLGQGQNPTWSPDGRYLIYEVANDDGHDFTSSDLWIASADGKWKQQLTNTPDLERFPAWSPDGKYLVYEIDGQIFYSEIGQ